MRASAPGRRGRARVLPAPWLSAALLALWLMLNQSVAWGTLLLGAAVAVLVPWLVAPLRPAHGHVQTRRPVVALRLLGCVIRDVVLSSLQVARGVLRRAPPRAAMVRVPLELRAPNGLALLAIIMCLTPDTLWAELSADGGVLTIHVFDLTTDEATYVDEIKTRYEQPLLELFPP